MHNSLELSFDLIILGQDPAVCLLALLAARSGHQVAVVGSAVASCPFWGVASAPFAWFGEPEPQWQMSWIKSVLTGMVWLESEKEPDLVQFPFHQLDHQVSYQAMRQDAETWGAVFFDGLPALSSEGVVVNERLLSTPVCFDLRPAAPNLSHGRWIWSSELVLSAPGVFEIYPEQGPLWIWSESLAESYFSLAGEAGTPPDLTAFFSDPADLMAFAASPLFLGDLTELAPIAWQSPVLRFPTPPAGPDPWRAVGQALYLLWARYAGQEIAQRGLSDPLLWKHLQGYWQKLSRVAEQKREKIKFLH